MLLSVQNCVVTLQHLVASTLAQSRGVPASELLADVSASDDLQGGRVNLDSLEQLIVARQVAEFFELDKAGIEEFLLRRSRLGQWGELIVENLDDGTLTHLWFRSGGTTGEPRLISQSVARLLSEVRELHSLVPDTTRIVSLVPLHHIYGFIWGPLLSDQSGVPLIHGPEAIKTAHRNLRPGDLLLAVPEWWQYLASSRKSFPARVQGVTSTAACPSQVIQAVLANGLESMIEVYGASETAGIGWRRDSEKGFRLFQHWKKYDDDRLESAQGRIHLLPDMVDWESDRLLVPRSRRDGAVQVGGVNVWPDRVRAYIADHPRVQACAVRPFETENGTRLKAFIVPAVMADEELRSQLQVWLASNLCVAERPAQLTLGDQLPRDSMGKLCDW